MAGKITLDKSRGYGEVHGETGAHNIAFEQDGLPFDAQGALIEGALTPDLREVVKRRLAKMAKGAAKRAAEAEAEADDEDGSPAADEPDDGTGINLLQWVKGNEKYQWHVIQQEFRKRHAMNVNDGASAAEVMVVDLKIVTWDEVAPQYRSKMAA